MAKKTKQQKEAANLATVEHFEKEYGPSGTKLEGWQKLCRDVGVTEGRSITQCKKHLQGVYVNIVDFVAALQAGRSVHRFPSRAALRDYIWNTGKVFPLNKAKQGSFLKAFLIHLG